MDLTLEINKYFDETILTEPWSGFLELVLLAQVNATDKERPYHSVENHVFPMLKEIDKRYQDGLKLYQDEDNRVKLKFAAVYHDIIQGNNTPGENEKQSAEICEKDLMQFERYRNYVPHIKEMILATFGHESEDPLVREFLKLDLDGFRDGLKVVLENEVKIRGEYGSAPWEVYKNGRIKFLEKYIENSIIKEMGVEDVLKRQMEYLEFYTPKIAIYPGTFQPWHLGHQDIFQKLEKIFDKVIVVFAKNDNKLDSEVVIPEILKNTQTVILQKGVSLISWVESLPYPVTIARGIRNGTDLLAEQNYFKWLKELAKKPEEIRTISILADPALEHISSSTLKNISAVDVEVANKFIFK